MSKLMVFIKIFCVVLGGVFVVVGVWIMLGVREPSLGNREGIEKNMGMAKIVIDYEEVEKKSKQEMLNYAIPKDFLFMVDGVMGRESAASSDKLRSYYEKVVYLYPDNVAEAQSMLGFIYSKKGDRKKALDFYREALELDPVNFWHAYNLGVLLYPVSPEVSRKFFNMAIQVSAAKSVNKVLSSPLYRQIKVSMKEKYDLVDSLKQSYADVTAVVNFEKDPATLSLKVF